MIFAADLEVCVASHALPCSEINFHNCAKMVPDPFVKHS